MEALAEDHLNDVMSNLVAIATAAVAVNVVRWTEVVVHGPSNKSMSGRSLEEANLVTNRPHACERVPCPPGMTGSAAALPSTFVLHACMAHKGIWSF